MKRLLGFALALTLFAAPTVALAEEYHRAETVGELCSSVPGPSWTEVFYPGLCQAG